MEAAGQFETLVTIPRSTSLQSHSSFCHHDSADVKSRTVSTLRTQRELENPITQVIQHHARGGLADFSAIKQALTLRYLFMGYLTTPRPYSVEWQDYEWIMNQKGRARKQLWPNLKYNTGIWLETLRKSMRNLILYTQCPSRDLNSTSPEYA
jgi:hypothetical protein